MVARFAPRVGLLTALLAAPAVLVLMALNIAATPALLVLGVVIWAGTRPMHNDLKAARAKCAPKPVRRLDLHEDQIDEEFRRITAAIFPEEV